MNVQAELFNFDMPGMKCSLIFKNVPTAEDVSDEDLIAFFEHDIGPVRNLLFFEQDPTISKNTRSGVVFYYCQRDARRALLKRNRTMFHSRRIILNTNLRPDDPANESKFQLSTSSCIEAANHFLGYNNWSSEIMEIEFLQREQRGQNFYVRARCVVRHIIRTEGKYVEASGEGEGESDEQLTAIGIAKKKALSVARKNAFKKIAIVLLPDDKIFVHLTDGKSLKIKPDIDEDECGPIGVDAAEVAEIEERAAKKRRFPSTSIRY